MCCGGRSSSDLGQSTEWFTEITFIYLFKIILQANIIGEHINTEINDEIEAKFSLAMYRDPNFTIPFEDGEKVDIGPDADIQKIYVRGQAEDIKAAFDG